MKKKETVVSSTNGVRTNSKLVQLFFKKSQKLITEVKVKTSKNLVFVCLFALRQDLLCSLELVFFPTSLTGAGLPGAHDHL